MSRFLWVILILSLLKNDVKCGTLGKVTNFHESLMPRTKDDLPTNSSESNSTLFSLNEVFSNSSKIKSDFTNNITSMRAAKFFIPKFEFLAGLNLGGGLSHSNMASLANLAKISGSPSLSPPALLNPFVAASYDPYPYVTASYTVQQSINDLTQLLQLIKTQLESSINTRNHSVPMNDKFMNKFISDLENAVDIVDDRKRRKDKTKMKNKIKKMREEFELQEEEDEDNEILEDLPVEPVRRKPPESINRQAAMTMRPTTFDRPETETPRPETTTIAPNTSNDENGTQNGYKGYHGGQPQSIGNLQITYDLPQETYGPAFHVPGTPIWTSGFPSQFFGSPWQSPGFPSGSYGSPSVSYGLPSQSYGHPSLTSGSNAPSYVPSPQTSGLFPSSYNPPSQTSGPVSPSYGPPPQTSGPISQSYGPPSQFYGLPGQISISESPSIVQPTQFPTQTRQIADAPQFSNPTSNFNGLPNYAYPHYPPYFDSLLNDDLGSNSFASSRSWPSNLSLARSRHFRAATELPSGVKSVNGFVPN